MKRFDAAYRFIDGQTRLNETELNPRFQDLDVRLDSLERIKPELDSQVDSLIAVGLQRINDSLGPFLDRLATAAELGFLIGPSATDVELIEGELAGFVIGEDNRSLFSPTPFLSVLDNTDQTAFALLQLVSYDPLSGLLTVEVVSVHGGETITSDNWTVAASGAVFPMMVEALASAQTAAETGTSKAAEAVAARNEAVPAAATATAAAAAAVAAKNAAEAAAASIDGATIDNRLDAIETGRGAANGYASLDGDGRIPLAQIPESLLGALAFQGTWNATTNTPTIPAAAPGNAGHFYVVATAGSTSIDGISSWAVGDWVLSNGATWEKIGNTDSVSSVAGKTGAVTLVKADVGLGNVTNTNDANKPVSSAQQTALDLKLNAANPTTTGKHTTAASAAESAGFNLPPGTAPTAPDNGDTWTTATGIFARVGGVTRQLFSYAGGVLTGFFAEKVVALTDTSNVAINAALGNVFDLVAGGNRTLQIPTSPTDGQKIIIRHKASGGARTLAAVTSGAGSFRFNEDVTSFTATTSGKTDMIGALYNGTDQRWDIIAVTKGC